MEKVATLGERKSVNVSQIDQGLTGDLKKLRTCPTGQGLRDEIARLRRLQLDGVKKNSKGSSVSEDIAFLRDLHDDHKEDCSICENERT